MENQANTIVVSSSSMKDGIIEISGYKHAMVQVIAVAISNNTKVSINNVPRVDDTFVLCEIINQAGGNCVISGNTLICDPSNMTNPNIDENLSKRIHGSIYLMPAYLCRFGKFSIGKTGGCQIGSYKEQNARPLEHMLSIMRMCGADIDVSNLGNIIGSIKNTERKELVVDIYNFSISKEMLAGSNISGATKTAILMMPVLSKLTLKNPYFKTDVRDLIRFYELLGCAIYKNASVLQIINNLKTNSIYQFSLTECISEIMTYIAVAVHMNIRIRLKIKNIHSVKIGLEKEFKILKEIGVQFTICDNYINILESPDIKSINIDVTNDTIQSDHLPFFALILMKAKGASILREFVWPERFAYVKELQKLGANLIQDGNTLIVNNSSSNAANSILYGHDTRSAAMALLAALATTGNVIIKDIKHINRGYENLINNLNTLGANIEFVNDSKTACLL